MTDMLERVARALCWKHCDYEDCDRRNCDEWTTRNVDARAAIRAVFEGENVVEIQGFSVPDQDAYCIPKAEVDQAIGERDGA